MGAKICFLDLIHLSKIQIIKCGAVWDTEQNLKAIDILNLVSMLIRFLSLVLIQLYAILMGLIWWVICCVHFKLSICQWVK